jgi:hypothetical protein
MNTNKLTGTERFAEIFKIRFVPVTFLNSLKDVENFSDCNL